MGDSEPELLCYNRGCGKTFKESENSFNACRFHPGTPFFHDAYKGWTCCRKSTDFTEFLNMKGCATGYHTNVKPPEPEKPKQEVSTEDVIVVNQPRYVQKERPPVNAPLVRIVPTLSESLKKQTFGERKGVKLETEEDVVKVGVTQCVNKGCKRTYDGPETDTETCKFHPGVPIFHEGLKFWSCCQKRTTDFDVFMKQEGCQQGSHCWVKPKNNEEGEGGTVLVKCRHDWHQDGSFVHVVIYAGGKKFDPECSSVQANGVKLRVELYFPEEHCKYEEEWVLAGIIHPEQSSVLMTPMKVELKLRKAEPLHWANLNITEAQQRATVADANNADECKSVGVDPVDLSDL